ncbi:TPA: hypothetical protein ACXIEZ_006608 [Pseudomonas aeruginosa]
MKKLVFLFFAKKALLFALMFTPVFASAAPAFSPKFGQAVGGVIEQKAIKRGFAANDPKFTSTYNAVGAALTVVATGTAAAVGAPLWLTIAVGAATTFAVTLAVDSVYQWIFNSDGTVTPPAPGGDGWSDPVGDFTPQDMVQGGPYFGDMTGTCPSGSPMASILCALETSPNSVGYGYSINSCFQSGNQVGCSISYIDYTWGPSTMEYYVGRFESGAPANCPVGTYYDYIGCATPIGSPPATDPEPVQPVTPEVAAQGIPAAELAKPLNYQVMADAINKYWQQASYDPNYSGVPYSFSDPVTSSDVMQWATANPSIYPSVGDAVSSPLNPSTGTVPVTSPSTGTGTNPSSPTEINVTLDLGPDPGIGSPNLEATPTGAQILEPLTNLFPDLRNFQVPAHQAECPRPVFDLAVIGKQVQMDAHCTISEDVRGPLYNASLLGWVLAALFIVLSA